MKCEIHKHHIYVKTPFHMKDCVKHTLNGVWTPNKQMYRFPLNIHCLRELYTAFPALRDNPEFMDAGRKLRVQMDRLLDIKRKEDTDGNPELRPYQRVDVEYLKALPYAGVFNEPRTGKTPTVITLMQELETVRNIIIVPSGLVLNWAKEFEKWYPEAEVFAVQGTPKKREVFYHNFMVRSNFDPAVLIISKDTLKGSKDLPIVSALEYDFCAVDEAHFLRNYESNQSKAVYTIGKKSARRYAMTGTPAMKDSTDLYGILHFLNPEKYSSYWQFIDRYFEQFEGMFAREIGNIKPNRKKEFTEMVGILSTQRKREEVMSWLPEVTNIPFYVELDSKQKKLYEQMEEDFFVEDGDNMVDTPSILTQFLRLRQLCLDPRLLGFDVVGAKTKVLLEWLEDNPTTQVLIMTSFTSYFPLIEPDLKGMKIPYGRITGKESKAEKDTAVAAFQNGELRIMLCNIQAAGFGFTLDAADTVIFLDKDFLPANNQQAQDRIVPTTEERVHPINVVSFIAKGTTDERINNILDRKISMTDYVNNGGANAIRQLLG